jgi:hypothetical protein
VKGLKASELIEFRSEDAIYQLFELLCSDAACPTCILDAFRDYAEDVLAVAVAAETGSPLVLSSLGLSRLTGLEVPLPFADGEQD